ncbi:hypothetical protein LRS10_22815 [Phenylobacterium sp. J426]|uniref:hypothetical protein n=1 Tax=Phenylobacterium sp. J426 TaxID=2898439 RepID=UPI0021515893|nr:hypothetical protein [Phenylobacterium sp. J426]MCR5876738.1 hypothetical protein [Phenylobacterium sp. J426]
MPGSVAVFVHVRGVEVAITGLSGYPTSIIMTPQEAHALAIELEDARKAREADVAEAATHRRI